MRKAHVLKENKGRESPDLVVYVDSESRVVDNVHYPYLIVACFTRRKRNKEVWREYVNDEIENFWVDVAEWGGRKNKKVYVFAHNMTYDLINTGGIKVLCGQGFRVDNYFEKGNVFIMDLNRYDPAGNVEKKIVLLSSTNYFAESLSSLGKTFGLEKLEFDYDNGSLGDAKIYCRRDVEILKTAVESFMKFVQEEDLGCLAKTLAGQAFNAFRHKFMKKNTIIIHNHEKVIELEREAYSGGRVECMKIGTFAGRFYYYDVNSMYPFVMKNFRYPVKLISYQKHCTVERLRKFIEQGKCVIARCIVHASEPVFPCKIKGNLIFPLGTFWTILTTPEIAYSLENGMIEQVDGVAIYEVDDIFSNYVDYFYTMRQEAKKRGNKVRDKMYKLLLNSLYGKFGQKGETWERIGDAPLDQIGVFERYNEQTGEKETLKIFGGSIFIKKDEGEAFNSFPAIAAHVTAYARMTLLRYIQIAGWEHVYYCDTDSLFVDWTGREKLEPYHNDTKLGWIKLEKEAEILQIFAPKDYKFGDIVKKKGIKKDSVALDDRTYKVQVWPKLNGCIREGILDRYKNIERLKVLKRQYTKGWILPDGRVVPFLVDGQEGQNIILLPDFELLYPEQVEWVRKKFGRDNVRVSDAELAAFYEKQYEKMVREERKQFRKLVIEHG